MFKKKVCLCTIGYTYAHFPVLIYWHFIHKFFHFLFSPTTHILLSSFSFYESQFPFYNRLFIHTKPTPVVQEAYDRVERGILLQKMKRLNFPDTLIDYLKDYYTHDSIITNAAGATTAKQYQSCSLCQGCPLSSILFVIYLIELGPRLDNSGLGVDLGDGVTIAYLKFADDVLASVSESDLEELKCKGGLLF